MTKVLLRCKSLKHFVFMWPRDVYLCRSSAYNPPRRQWRVASPKILGGGKMFGFRRITRVFGWTPLKAQKDYVSKNWGRAWPLCPPLATPMLDACFWASRGLHRKQAPACFVMKRTMRKGAWFLVSHREMCFSRID